jgi:hypothetical protein
MGWDWVIYIIIGLLAGAAMGAKKPPNQGNEPGEIDLPTAEEGKDQYVLFGTRDIRDPNIVWYGDVEARPIRRRGGKK